MITGLLDKFVREHGDYGYLIEEDCVELNYRSPCGRDFWAAIPFPENRNAKDTFIGFVRNLDIYCVITLTKVGKRIYGWTKKDTADTVRLTTCVQYWTTQKDAGTRCATYTTFW